jgi:predicted DNA-binding mobile mystery protein A
MRNDARQRARRRLDERLQALKPEDRFRAPPKGWIRAIRDALGMTGVQFAERLKIRPQSVEAVEKSEANGVIQLNTLRRAAEALDCTLVYALVPKTSLEGAVHNRARKIAMRDLGRVAHTMKLEAQDTGDVDLEARIEAYIRDMLRERDLWGPGEMTYDHRKEEYDFSKAERGKFYRPGATLVHAAR